MPTYEYRCSSCGHRFEKFQSMNAEPLRECPECKGVLERLIGAGGGFLVKGGGASAFEGICKARCGTEGPSCGLNAPCCGSAG
jgi:putative FmdB family regulatory protein